MKRRNFVKSSLLLPALPGIITSKSSDMPKKKKQEWYALLARFRAIFQYGYPKTDFFKIIPAIAYFLFVPYFLEKKLLKILHSQK